MSGEEGDRLLFIIGVMTLLIIGSMIISLGLTVQAVNGGREAIERIPVGST